MAIQQAIDVYGKEGATAVVELMRESGAEIATPADDSPTTPSVVAYINFGRWVTDCECGSAQVLDQNDQRFFCVRCLNSISNGNWRAVVWPAEASNIEDALLVRPDVGTRNWLPGQSVVTLEDENEARGLPRRASDSQ